MLRAMKENTKELGDKEYNMEHKFVLSSGQGSCLWGDDRTYLADKAACTETLKWILDNEQQQGSL